MYGVILAGGSGTRFWPLSRKKLPKQFLKLFDNRTLLEKTIQRLSPLIPPEKLIIVTTEKYRHKISEIVKDIPAENIILEPAGRNTAPAIALAAFKLIDKQEEVMGIFPSDHMILKDRMFCRILLVAEKIAKSSRHLITLGMKPDKPETGYGYIEVGKIYKREKGIAVFNVRRFVEKPDLKKAKAFLKNGNFMWNSGMFIWQVGVFLKELEKNLPEIYYGIKKGMKRKKNGQFEVDEKIYKGLQNISVDYGIMEKAGQTLVIPGEIGWSDLGSWDSLADVLEKDKSGNTVIADGECLFDVENSLFYANGKFVAGIGVRDLVVVNSDNAILICKKNSSQDVKKIVNFLNEKKKEEFL
jgi:mannose-1-phosphate guanylyltransferase